MGNGFLGRTICNVSKAGDFEVDVGSLNGGELVDVRKIKTVADLVGKTNPDTIINCAAVTDLDMIEGDPRDAYSTNSDGAGNVARIAAKHSKRLIHISTDSVFDGKRGDYVEGDKPNPVNEYAKSKKLGEDLVMKNSSNYVVVRTNFYGNNADSKFLFNWVLDNLRRGRKFSGFGNITFNPLEIENLAAGLLELASSKYTGILHMGADRKYSKYEFARAIAQKLGYNTGLIAKKELMDGETAARRPHDTTLANALSKRVLKTEPRPLDAWLEEIRHHL